ncbi:MAG: aminotransferase class V-fold PLP-dependent enzyme [Proteobacteria bacterium]|nr:aminotransferase class V-fold PLP-dependent enzyme [Pseudomonadota bacterium]NIS72505.1 aminotransferase class V-fold PLP-dependent enzyme [Pseudomonadota bacterium]
MGSGNTDGEVKRPIYLDYNATTPHHPEVIAAMRPFLEEAFGNPSSSYPYGIQTRGAIQHARQQVAALLNSQPEEVVFTSGGTESNNHAIKGIVFSAQARGRHIITTQIEHPAIIEVCKFLEQNDFEVTYLPVDEAGLVRISDLEKAITPQTILITIMHANNEVGTIQPIEQISQLAKERGITMHTDAAQSVGKIPTDVNVLGVDLLSLAGHKLYAPKGVGALYIRKGIQLAKFMHGAGQEGGRRAGTENVLEIVGLGKACEIARQDLVENMAHLTRMRNRLHEGLQARLGELRLNGDPERRLPNTLSLSFHRIDANALLGELEKDVAASAGAACHSGDVEISHVLEAMHVPLEWARGTLRFSTGRMTTETDIERAIDLISGAITRFENRQLTKK